MAHALAAPQFDKFARGLRPLILSWRKISAAEAQARLAGASALAVAPRALAVRSGSAEQSSTTADALERFVYGPPDGNDKLERLARLLLHDEDERLVRYLADEASDLGLDNFILLRWSEAQNARKAVMEYLDLWVDKLAQVKAALALRNGPPKRK